MRGRREILMNLMSLEAWPPSYGTYNIKTEDYRVSELTDGDERAVRPGRMHTEAWFTEGLE